MSKRFSNEFCVYYAVYLSEAPDQVFAKVSFIEDRRDILPQVPCCKTCNKRKLELDTYLTAVLPFGVQDAAMGERFDGRYHHRFRFVDNAIGCGMAIVSVHLASQHANQD